MKHETIIIRNAVCEAVICVRPFVHLIGFRLHGARNHLLNFETPNPIHEGHPKRPDFIVGGKLWYAPEVEGSHRFGMLTGKVTQMEREVDVQLDPDPESKLKGAIRFVLDEHRPLLTVHSSLQNIGTEDRETSCWWPVSFEQGGRMESQPMALPGDPAYRFQFWSYGGDASEPACAIGKKNVVLDLDRTLREPIFKIGFLGREILLTKADCAYCLTALDPPPGPQWTYPHGGSSVMLYSDQRTGFCEAELSGPLTRLRPSDTTSFTFSIALEPSAHES